MRHSLFMGIALLLGMGAPAMAAPTVLLEELTWPEVAARITTGSTTVLIPTGGTEQNGPHIALGKHNWIVRYTSEAIARELGDTLVAPVIGYVPEGSVVPPQGHMLFPGTISVSNATFSALLEDTARSFKQHGFRTIVFVGDSGGQQDVQKALAARLSKEWAQEKVTVVNATAYYDDAPALAYAKQRKLGGTAPQGHAGFFDTAETLAVHPEAVRLDKLMPYDEATSATSGVTGDPQGATAEHGKNLLNYKIAEAVAEIRRQKKP